MIQGKMKRIDRIFSALGNSKNKGSEKNADKSIKEQVEMDLACDEELSSNYIDKSFKEQAVMDLACDEEHSSNYIVDQNAQAVVDLTCNERSKYIHRDFSQTSLDMNNIQNDNFDPNIVEDSPLAPLFSPLTPLLARNKDYRFDNDENLNENSSPLRPMSPDTLNLYQTISTALDEEDGFEEGCKENTEKGVTQTEDLNNHNVPESTHHNLNDTQEEPLSDFSNDTDSDYIPDINSDQDSSSEKNSGRLNQTIQVLAIVHNDKSHSKNINTDLDTLNLNEELVQNKENANFTAVGQNKNTPNIHEDEDHLANKKNTSDNRIKNRQILTDDEISECSNNEETLNNHHTGNDIETEVTVSRPKRGRKRKYHDHTLAQAKERKYENLPYHSKKKYVTSKVFRDYACACLKLCHLNISKELRQKEFEKYVTLGSYEAQLLYILSCVTETPKSRTYTILKGNKTGKKKPRAFTRKYTICDIEVCRDMFINNFQLTPKKVDVALKKIRRGGSLKDQRGQSRGGWNKMTDDGIDFIKNIIDSLPKYESHYRREQNNGVQYLKTGTTLPIIYNLYLEKFKQAFTENKKPVSFTTLKRIFLTNFNLRFKSLKKDTCSRCDILTNKIKNSTITEEQKELLKEEKDKHLKRAEDLRNRMNQDIKKAKSDESFECLTFDLEKTLPLPRIPTSIVFYKRQLWLYNCGIHAGSNDCGHCYMWVEGEAGRGAQEVGSCLIHFIKYKLNPNVLNLSLWSDCCGGQNRNIKIVLMLKVILNSHPTLKTITLNYLESGHTFLPNDTDFSKIETQLKYHERVYTAEEYIKIIKNCKKKNPLQVYRMTQEDFLSSKNIEKKIVNRKTFVNKTKTNWLKTKEILLKKENENIIFMKTTLEDDFQELNIQKKIKGTSLKISDSDFSPLWPNGKEIPRAKLDDLKSMFDLIPKDCLGFYQTLRGNPTFVEDIDGFEGPTDFNLEDQEVDLDSINNDTE